ncbi:MAG: tRNA (adenosine(37)-N6)-dimethylallyltransferase MiaA [Bacteroidales bacterium]|nr:tRNA (adenosine(37)-N6)-dimethylallyltransferase MiaA [Bacteroidales bacterium]
MSTPTLITILGPTASGKTSLATTLASHVNGEIISADSRQVFRGMDIGTGKDLSEYRINGVSIPYHLIDICDPRTDEYNAYRFVNDFIDAFNGIIARGKQPILCGGTGLYIDAIVRQYKLPDAPIDPIFRESIAECSDGELTQRLASYVPLHNHTDTDERQRLIRALEIQEYRQLNPDSYTHIPPMQHSIFGLTFPRQDIIARIETRLDQRLEAGMIDEVQRLMENGVSPERLQKFGLEYRHITQFLLHQTTFNEMRERLFTDIRRFAKRQMTWFRRMQRNGVQIDWIDGSIPLSEKVSKIITKTIQQQ